ncbi:zinc finger protein 106 [Menidia menidia]
MADVQTPNNKVLETPTKKKKKQISDKPKNTYCIVCRKDYLKQDALEHIHSMLHHRELEAVLGKDAFHDCQACKAYSLGLNEYAQHISTSQHNARLQSLMEKNAKPISLFKTLSTEIINRIMERNKALKKEQKKTRKRKKKRKKKQQKQETWQRCVEIDTGAVKKKTKASKGKKQDRVMKKQAGTSGQTQQAHHWRSSYAVVQNKENKVISMATHLRFSESPPKDQTERPFYQPGQFRGQDQHHQYVKEPFPPSAHHLKLHVRYSATNSCSRDGADGAQTDRAGNPSYEYQKDGPHTSGKTAVPAVRYPDYRNRPDHSAADGNLSSRRPPQSGAPQPEIPSSSARPGFARTAAGAAVVASLLKNIRRALGVREPCRADREARKQNGEVRVRASPDVPAPRVSASAGAGVCPPVKPNLTASKKTQGGNQNSLLEKSSVAGEGLSKSRWGPPHPSAEGPASLAGRAKFSEPGQSSARKVRIAKSHAALHKKTVDQRVLDKLRSLSGARSKLSWKDMYFERKKKNRCEPRFGINLGNRQSEREICEGGDEPPLSQGFHWESIPDRPSSSHATAAPQAPPASPAPQAPPAPPAPPTPPAPQPPPAPPPSPARDGPTETQSDSPKQEPLEPPAAAQETRSGGAVAGDPVKVEPSPQAQSGGSSEQIRAGKRKLNMGTDNVLSSTSDGKKKKRESSKGQAQMDQLLAVSLREEELSRSLQGLDKSMVLARNALQAAYAEAQRMFLMKQQFTAEVNSLRAKRIEILQGMQERYSGAFNEVTSSSSPPPSVSSLPPSSALPSSLRQPPGVKASASLATPQPTPFPIKQEIFQQALTGQASPFIKNCTPNALQVPVNQSGPSHFAAPAQSSAPAAPADSSARQQGQEAGRVLGGRGGAAGASVKEAQPVVVIDLSGEEAEGKQSEGPVKEKDRRAPKSEEKPPDVADGGNESDDCVEMVSAPGPEVIDIDGSECEDSAKENPPTPRKCESSELSATSTQTSRQSEAERKVQPPAMLAPDASTPAGSSEDEEPSLGVFSSHAGPVHSLQVHNGVLYTCSGDQTARAYSLVSRECQAVFEGHTNKVNCLLVSSPPDMPARLYTGSSDQTIRCYSMKSKKCLEQISLPDLVLCLHIAWNILYAGLASGSVVSHDLKTVKQLDVFECHGPRGVSCLGTTQEGARRVLLVGSYDSTISVRDAKSGLMLRSLQGHSKTVLCMKVVNDLVFSGSSDTSVHAHNIHTGELLRIYKGHGNAVTSIVILGQVMVTACLDNLVRVYELQSHDCLQVYGGYSDMVICMAVHKSVIYTGCYNGSVQAVKLDLTRNHRCWWHSCSLVFGIPEHLVQHLVGDHTNPNLQAVKCRWRGCSAFFLTQQSVRQELPAHMQSHVEDDSRLQP